MAKNPHVSPDAGSSPPPRRSRRRRSSASSRSTGRPRQGGHGATSSHSSHATRTPASHLPGTMGHAAMIGEEAPAVGGPNDLDALLYPPRPLPAQPGACASTASPRSTRSSRSRPASSSPPGRTTAPSRAGDPRDRGRHPARPLPERRLAPAHDPLPRDPPGEHGRRLRGRRAGRRVHVRVRGAARRLPPLPLPRDAAQEAHPQGPLRRVHHRPERAAPARAGARDGDERLRHRRATARTTSTRSTGARSTTRATRSASAARSSSASTSRT